MNFVRTFIMVVVIGLALWGCEQGTPATPMAAPATPDDPAHAGNAPLPAVAAMDEATLRAWADKGVKAWQARTCFMCHSLKGAPLSGPSPIGIWGSKQKLVDGREVLVDEAYIRQSILEPGVAITAGYSNMMLPYKGVVTEEELTALAALFRAVKDGPLPPAPGPAGPP